MPETPDTVPVSDSPGGEREFREALTRNLFHIRGQNPHLASDSDVFMTLAHTVRDHMMPRWRKTVEQRFRDKPRYLCYLSAEYLLGRQLGKNMLYTETTELARKALAHLGLDLEDLIAVESEPGLGNGGLGRLAACFLDSLATLDVPCIGYGLRYEFGIFRQRFEDGWQVECPDDWLFYGNPWEFPQPDDMVEVGFGGRTEQVPDKRGGFRVKWIPDERVLGEPIHTMVPGFRTDTVNILRLWRARATMEFDLQMFDVGDYARAVHQKTLSENLTKVLYPNDATPQGRELRLKQQYFFAACSLQDIIRWSVAINGDLEALPEKIVIQLNDTHPVVAVPELLRLLIDDYGIAWEKAWDMATRMFAYTCHTLMPEALEQWPVDLFKRLLPRHFEIVEEIDRRLLQDVGKRFPNEPDRAERMSIIRPGRHPTVRMANLASIASFSINGVAKLQSDLLEERVLSDFAEMWPDKFNNKTNGVTPRRFLQIANPRLSELITSRIGDEWPRDLGRLRRLEESLDDDVFTARWREVKAENKVELASFAAGELGIDIDPTSMFDVMVKRLHEYKRQLLKVLHIIVLYRRLKEDPDLHTVPRTFVFGAKAAPGYQMAKLIIKLINSVGHVVNGDSDIGGRLRVAFLPNFNVTLGELIYPAADVSEQISMAGKEASGTGNMKLAMNGALTIGTLDGANIEIREQVGEENFFLFGLTAPEALTLKEKGHRPSDYIEADDELRLVIEAISNGYFSDGDSDLFQPLVRHLYERDDYLVCADFRSYIDTQDAVDEAFKDEEAWTRKSIINCANSGYFSSDRTIREYCREIWRIPESK